MKWRAFHISSCPIERTGANKMEMNVAGLTFSNYQPLRTFEITFKEQKIMRKKALTLIVIN